MFESIHEGRPNGFVEACWPRSLTPDGAQLYASGFIAHKNMDRSVKWSKVTDTDTGDIIGFRSVIDTSQAGEDGKPKIVGVAQWAALEDATQHYANCLEVAPEDTRAYDLDKEHAGELWEGYIRPRRKLLEDEKLPTICLPILCVWPPYQKQGAGKSR
ncbi:hypothetical protein K458DRAFT_436839 [Lentithecium fluviatile CBS 122367]|uniref:Uncharacterized protein n=1 Tax=Lentithecium fluviatile CBS 122367 TaxID=1168545 RepID=A0A6G1IG76_9PLEO|nr:hypothetical protein K458DRAFT_436839 [Lentithecium fluviatile CBS 122367]